MNFKGKNDSLLTGSGITAIVLCGGKGERLLPLTADRPKPLIKVKGLPILGHLINYLSFFQFKEILLLTGHMSEMIDSFVSSQNLGVGIVPVRTLFTGNQDIAGRIKQAISEVNGDFMVFYGDTLSNVSISELLKFYSQNPQKAVVTVWPLRSSFGVFQVRENGEILDFKEKPLIPNHWINIGHFYFPTSFRREILRYNNFEIFLSDLAEEGKIRAFKHNGVHLTVNTRKELDEAEQSIFLLERGGVSNDRVLEQ